jgi:hypothetical protein
MSQVPPPFFPFGHLPMPSRKVKYIDSRYSMKTIVRGNQNNFNGSGHHTVYTGRIDTVHQHAEPSAVSINTSPTSITSNVSQGSVAAAGGDGMFSS